VSLVLTRPEEQVPPQPVRDEAPGRLSAWIVRWRLALRLARRDARRAKGRTAIVACMVGLPVLAIVGGDTLFQTHEVTAVDRLTQLGAADARIEGVSRGRLWADPLIGEAIQFDEMADPPWTADEVRALLPTGARLAEQRQAQIALRTDLGYATLTAYAADLTDPIRKGAFAVVDGEIPDDAGEVAISPIVARRGIGVGDEIRLTRDDVPATVVGVLDPGGAGDSEFVLLPPRSADLLASPTTVFFADVPGVLDWPAVRDLNGAGLAVLSRAVVADPPAESEYMPPGYETGSNAADVAVIALIVAALLLEIVLLAGPAFAVGLRRQRRDLALLAANGGSPAHLRRMVLASGLALGGGAAVLGALLGIAGARLAIPVLESRTSEVFGPFEVPVLHVLVVVTVGALAGLAAASVPARQAARTDVVTTLTGRRGQVATSLRLPLIGLLMTAAGVVLSVLGARGGEFAVAAGAVLLILGLVVAMPWLVGLLAPLARRLPLAGRLAVRDATRNRTRTAPAVAAVMATVAGVTALAIGNASDTAQSERDYIPRAAMGTATVELYEADEDGWDTVVRAVQAQVPDRQVYRLQGPLWQGDQPEDLMVQTPGCTAADVAECSWFPEDVASVSATSGTVGILDADALVALAPPEVADRAVSALRSGRPVVFGKGALDASGQLTLAGTRYDGRAATEVVGTLRVPATEIPVRPRNGVLQVPALVVLPPSMVSTLPVGVGTRMLAFGGPDDPVSTDEERRVDEVVAGLAREHSTYVERGWPDESWVARLLLLVVGGTLVLVATLTATGLAVADARPDLGTLAAIGAAPRTRRFMAMGSAAVIGGTGALLGVLAGMAPGIAVAYPLTSDYYGTLAEPVIRIPWDLLAAVAVGVPVLAVVVTGLVVRSRLPMARRVDA
jgi:putative ABC transport system permease protein